MHVETRAGAENSHQDDRSRKSGYRQRRGWGPDHAYALGGASQLCRAETGLAQEQTLEGLHR